MAGFFGDCAPHERYSVVLKWSLTPLATNLNMEEARRQAAAYSSRDITTPVEIKDAHGNTTATYFGGSPEIF